MGTITKIGLNDCDICECAKECISVGDMSDTVYICKDCLKEAIEIL